MTDPSLYRDDARVRHMLSALERIVAMSEKLGRSQLRMHEDVTEIILFNLMILGEAANNISKEFAEMNPEVDWRGVAGVRHKIVHDYADIDFDTIGDILLNDIPYLYQKVKAVAATLPPGPTEPPTNMADFL